MRETVTMPKLGDTADDVLIVGWAVEVGGRVEEGAALCNVETDKIETEVPSPVAGELVERLVAEGDEVSVGSPIAVIRR